MENKLFELSAARRSIRKYHCCVHFLILSILLGNWKLFRLQRLKDLHPSRSRQMLKKRGSHLKSIRRLIRKFSQVEHTIDTYRRYLINHRADRKHFSYSSRSGSWPALPPKDRPVRKRAGLSLWKKSMLYSKKKNQTCMKKRRLTVLKVSGSGRKGHS